ncbi:MAG: hypothetical protein FD138_1141 [Planctomycetota bacterium]|nr:MAG: hypothetical protein FD138_1141 [Planctomycetota bacterium]
MLANHLSETVATTPKPRRGLTLGEFVIATGIVLLIGFVTVAFFFPPVRRSREAARRSQCKNNLKQIAIALHNYHDKYQAFPPAYTVDAEGKPLHSWRTLILPFLEEQALYAKIDLTKPWDDQANAEVFKTNVNVYCCPSELGPTTNCLRPGESARLSDIKDGTSNTLMVTEVDSEHAVPWMAPTDADESLFLAISPTSKLAHTGGVQAALADGSVRFLNASMPAEIRRALISIDGNEKLTDY